ncbi:MAG: type IV toxin-antitoxin system AbiEi family antitoxin domain-containing protein [Acidimicrobiales bacterium]
MTKDRGLELLDRLTREGRTAISADEIRTTLGLTPQTTSNLLNRLTRAGLVDRVATGRYAIRQLGALGTAAVWDDLGSAVAALFGGHSHRIGFLTALDHHGVLVRPVRPIQVASPFRPRKTSLAGRPLSVVRESEATVLIGTRPFGPSRLATLERALLDTASKPQLTGGATRLAEALAGSGSTTGLRDLVGEINAGAAYRRIGSIALTLSLPVAEGLEPLPWRTLIELDRRARSEGGWVDTTWGVAWPYPPSELEAVVAA